MSASLRARARAPDRRAPRVVAHPAGRTFALLHDVRGIDVMKVNMRKIIADAKAVAEAGYIQRVRRRRRRRSRGRCGSQTVVARMCATLARP
eukprot:4329712-Prymnesium_polylepis.2